MKKFKEAYFVLYDDQDFPICYFENVYELLQLINYSTRDLLKRFNKYGDLIHIIINHKKYSLMRFCD